MARVFKYVIWFWAALMANFSAASANAQDSNRMAFTTADSDEAIREITIQGYRSIYASGPIQEGDTDRFTAFVRNHHLDAARVVLNSPGGSLLEGVRLGRAIRALNFDTAIGVDRTPLTDQRDAICASACAYAFAGGVLRFISPDDGKLGLHQFRTARGPGISEGDAQTVSGLLVAYLSEMGVDAKAFALASVTDPNGIIWLDARDAETLGFANNGVLPTTADVKIANMHPYLRLNQVQPGVQLRVLITCFEGKLSLLAGVVTEPERSQGLVDPEWLKRSYLEFDGTEEMVMPSASGAQAQDSTVWLSRQLRRPDVDALLRADELGIWLDGFGMLRAGGAMDLRRVRPAMKDYIGQCFAG